MARQEIGGLENSTLFVSVVKPAQLTRYGGRLRCHDPRCGNPELTAGMPVLIRVRGSRVRHYYCLPCAVAGNHITVQELKLVLPRVLKCRNISCLNVVYTSVISHFEEEAGLVVA